MSTSNNNTTTQNTTTQNSISFNIEGLDNTQIYKRLICTEIDSKGYYTLVNYFGAKIHADKALLQKLEELGYTIINYEDKGGKSAFKDKGLAISRMKFLTNGENTISVDLVHLINSIETILLLNEINTDCMETLILKNGADDINELTTRMRLLSGDNTIIEFSEYNAILNLCPQDKTVEIYFGDKVEFTATVNDMPHVYNLAVILDDLDMVAETLRNIPENLHLSSFELNNTILDCEHIDSLISFSADKISINNLYLPNCKTINTLIDFNSTWNPNSGLEVIIDSINAPNLEQVNNLISNRNVNALLAVRNIVAPKLTSVRNLFMNIHVLDRLEIQNINVPNIKYLSNIFDRCNVPIYYDGSIKGTHIEHAERIINNSTISKVDTPDLNMLYLNTSRGKLKTVISLINNSNILSDVDLSNLDLAKLDKCIQPITSLISGKLKLGTNINSESIGKTVTSVDSILRISGGKADKERIKKEIQRKK